MFLLSKVLFPFTLYLTEGEGNGGGGNGGNGGNGGGGEGGAGSEKVQQLQTKLEGLQTEMTGLKEAKGSLERKLGDADKELLSPEYLEFLEGKKGEGKPKAGEEGAEGDKEPNFDEMTPTQIAKHFSTKHTGKIEGITKDIDEKLGGLEKRVGDAMAQIDLVLTGMKHTDFGEALETPKAKRDEAQKTLIDSVYKIAEENPTWSSERCYRQAKLEMTQTATDKAEAEKEKAEKDAKTLTEKGGASSFTVQGKTPTKEQASDAAWKSAFGKKETIE